MAGDSDRNILVFDVGSSALKATVFDASGHIVDRAEASYPHAAGSTRQSPWDWWGAAVAAARQLDGRPITAISLTGTMENLIPVDASGEPLGEALLYFDPCGEPFVAEAAAALADAGAARRCGNAPDALMTAFKLAWLRRHEPKRFAAARWFLPGSKDYLALKLTGEVVTDPTCAATTGLMDIASRDWSNPLRAIFGIERRRLPHIRPATDMVGHLTAAAAEELRLPPGLPVVNGCGDGGATTMGGGAEHPADVSVYLGTSGWAAHVVRSAALAEESRFYRLPHPVGEGIIEIAPILSAGAAAAWARQVLGVDVDEAERLAQVADVAPGKVLFLPYLSGERSPFLDLDIRGGFLGLSPSDGPAQLYYAALEGVAMAIEANLRAMGVSGRKVSLVGGGALSKIWLQIIADVTGAPVTTSADPVAATSFGAFRIAQRALRLPVSGTSFSVAATPRADRVPRAAAMRERFAQATGFARQLRRP